MTIVLIIFGLLFTFVFLGFPVAFSIGFTTLTSLLYRGTPLTIMVQRMVNGLDSFPFLAIPLFILAGNLMNQAGITDKIFAFALSLVGHIRGSLAHVNVVASIIFAGISGVAQADAAGLGVIEIRAMEKAGYDKAFSAAVTATSSIIGPIIPPSVIMAVFSVIAGISLGKLFVAGFIPGLIMGFSQMFLIYIMATTGRIKGEVYHRPPIKQILKHFLDALPAIIMPIILVVAMIVGAATPTELGSICVVYAILLSFLYRTFSFKMLFEVFCETTQMVGILVFVISVAFPFSWLIATYNVPSLLIHILEPFKQNQWQILLIMNLILLFLGMFMETTAILLIMVPLLFPLATSIGINEIHFGLIVIINLLIGAVTPPFGMCLYIVTDIAKIPFVKVVKATIPFLIPLLFTLFLVTYWPQMVLFLPKLLFK
jgi:tripartite ATP-independent transporter DctM subunit